MLSRPKQSYKAFFAILAIALIFPNFQISAQTNNGKDMNEHFKTGVLKDYTSKEISADSVEINPKGPFFMVVGIDRGAYEVDGRVDGEREKIKFEVIKGGGSFADASNPTDDKSGDFLITPNDDGAVAALFYPKTGFFSSDDYQVKVTVVNQKSTNITGELLFVFHGTKLDPDLLEKVKSGYKNYINGVRNIGRTESTHFKTVYHDRPGIKEDRVVSNDFSRKVNSDGSIETQDNNGVMHTKKTAEEDGSFLSSRIEWGIDENHVIFLSCYPYKSKIFTGACAFTLIDRNNYYEDGSYILNGSLFSLVSRSYENVKGVILQKSTSNYESLLTGKKIQEWESLTTNQLN
jgi:hypothetical protein